MALTHAAKNLSAALAELRTAAGKAQDACGSMDIDSALSQVRKTEKNNTSARRQKGLSIYLKQ